ncbi:MAG: hypothetical protein ACXVJ3_15070, partial [Ilumatobacteraceae bacterium]
TTQGGTYSTAGKDGNDPSTWTSTGSTPNKTDFAQAYATSRVVDVNGTPHFFVYVAWERTDTTGTQGYAIEISNAGSNVAADGTPQPNRSNGGDVFYLSSQGSSPPVFDTACSYTSQSDYGTACSSSTANVTAAINTVSMSDPLNNTTQPAGAFFEVALDVTGLNGVTPGCPGTAANAVYLRSITGQTSNGNLKGYMAPLEVAPDNTCQPDLSVTKTADHASVSAGDPIGFTVTVANSNSNTTGTAKNVTLDDPLPAGSGTGVTWSLDSGPTGTVTPKTCAVSNTSPQHLTCTGIDMKPGDHYSVHVTATTSKTECTKYDNTATASADNSDPVEGSASITCNPANLVVTKTADAASVNAGDQIGFNVELKNTGTGTATGVQLSDPLPAGSGSGVTWSIDTQSPANSFTLGGSSGSQTLSLTGQPVSLAPGADLTVHIIALTSATECSTYDNTATVTSTNDGGGNPSASIVCHPAAIHIVKAPDAAQVNVGSPIGFTLTVSNSGSGEARGVKLSDTLPGPPTNLGLSWSIDKQGSGWAGSCSISAGVLSCGGANGVTVPAGTTQTASTFTVHITSPTTGATGGDCPETGVVDNTGSVTTSNDGSDQSSASVCVQAVVDLAITKTGSPATQDLGQGNITWTMVVTNNGPSTATGVKVSDPMPAGNTYVSSTTTQGTCTGGAILNCDIGTMAAGATVTITLITTPSQPGTQTNTAVVSSSRPESNLANNTATASVEVTAPLQLACVRITKITPGQLVAGRKTQVTIHLAQKNGSVKGIRVRIKGAGINVKTAGANSKGIIRHTLKVKKQGILVFTPLASPSCVSRIGVRGVFTPPVTG